jgi:hypothetical protein
MFKIQLFRFEESDFMSLILTKTQQQKKPLNIRVEWWLIVKFIKIIKRNKPYVYTFLIN